MNKKQKKKFKKQNKDKILLGKGAIRTLNMPEKNEQSKKIKKHQFKGKNVITDEQVRNKLKTRRMVVSSYKLK